MHVNLRILPEIFLRVGDDFCKKIKTKCIKLRIILMFNLEKNG